MPYKTYRVRDMRSHRTYSIRRCDIQSMEAPIDLFGEEKPHVKKRGCFVILKHPIKRSKYKVNARSIILCAKTIQKMGLWSRFPLDPKEPRQKPGVIPKVITIPSGTAISLSDLI